MRRAAPPRRRSAPAPQADYSREAMRTSATCSSAKERQLMKQHTGALGDLGDRSPDDSWENLYREHQENHAVWGARTNPLLVGVAERLPVGTALDLGCGTGDDTFWLARHGWEVGPSNAPTLPNARRPAPVGRRPPSPTTSCSSEGHRAEDGPENRTEVRPFPGRPGPCLSARHVCGRLSGSSEPAARPLRAARRRPGP